jgi:hypothetical protein
VCGKNEGMKESADKLKAICPIINDLKPKKGDFIAIAKGMV